MYRTLAVFDLGGTPVAMVGRWTKGERALQQLSSDVSEGLRTLQIPLRWSGVQEMIGNKPFLTHLVSKPGSN